MKDVSTPREVAEMLHVVSALVDLGHLDARGRASVRLRSGSIVATPRPGPGVPPPGRLSVRDLVTLDPDGRRVDGRWQPSPEVIADLELYRRRPDVRAVVHGQPEVALAFAAAGRPLAPLTHTEAALVLPTLPVISDPGLVDTADAAGALADAVGQRPVAIIRGSGSIAVGGSPAEAGMLTHQLELLARVNQVAATTRGAGDIWRGRTVSASDSARISAQKAPPSDFQDFFDELAEAAPPGSTPPDPDDGSEDGLRARIVAACRLLQQHGLVEHLEHVSARLPGVDAFLITPRKHLGLLRGEEIAVVGMDGTWRSGEHAPPPFLWLHRDIFAARPDVDAIVHTHQTVARALVMAGVSIEPIDRAGASWLTTPAAVYPVPDLMFEAVHREAAIAALSDARILHEAAHGTDYLAPTVEEATVAAILFERQARMWHLAGQLGTPAVLPATVLEAIEQAEPGYGEWWRHLLSKLPARDDPTDESRARAALGMH